MIREPVIRKPVIHRRSIRLPDLLPIAVGILIVGLVAGLTHLVAILLLPTVATRDAYDLLAAYAKKTKPDGNGMVLLGPARPGDTLIPFRDPAAVQGLCFFDLAAAPVRIKTKVEEGRLLTLSFRTRDGRIFYSMTDRASVHGGIDIRLVTAPQLAAVAEGDDEDAGLPEELRLKAPLRTGLVIATALIARPSERADAEARIKAIECKPEPLDAPS